MYLSPHDLLVMTAAGLAPPRQPDLHRDRPTPTGAAVRRRPRRRSAALRRKLGRLLLRAGVRLLRSARVLEGAGRPRPCPQGLPA